MDHGGLGPGPQRRALLQPALTAAGASVDEGSQILIPEAFLRLFVPAGRLRPTASREHIAQRHEFCEDLAQALTETARLHQFELSITEEDVLTRVAAGLQGTGSPVSADEAAWVVGRLAELLGWPLPGAGEQPLSGPDRPA